MNTFFSVIWGTPGCWGVPLCAILIGVSLAKLSPMYALMCFYCPESIVQALSRCNLASPSERIDCLLDQNKLVSSLV